MNKVKREIIFKKFGGKCSYCGCDLDSKWQVDHVVSKSFAFGRGVANIDQIENLMPACRKCNHYKRGHCLDDDGKHIGFRTYMLNFHKRLAKLPKRTSVKRTQDRIEYLKEIAEKYGITPQIPFTGKFYFETLKEKEEGK